MPPSYPKIQEPTFSQARSSRFLYFELQLYHEKHFNRGVKLSDCKFEYNNNILYQTVIANESTNPYNKNKLMSSFYYLHGLWIKEVYNVLYPFLRCNSLKFCLFSQVHINKVKSGFFLTFEMVVCNPLGFQVINPVLRCNGHQSILPQSLHSHSGTYCGAVWAY